MNTRKVIFQDYRTIVFPILAATCSSLALSPNASIFPSIITLSILKLYSPFVFRRSHDGLLHIALLWLGLTIGGSLPWLVTSSNALSSFPMSMFSLFFITAITSAFVIGIIFIDVKITCRLRSPWSQLCLFPALWATIWCTIAYISPVGHLTTWSPNADDSDAYNWLIPILGPASKDWVIGAWAVVVSQAAGAWYMGEADDESLITNVGPPKANSRIRLTSARANCIFAAVLAILTIPSLVTRNFLPLPLTIQKATPLSVSCVLPRYGTHKHHTLGLNDFITETKQVQSSAKVILWPERAVSFESVEARDQALESIRRILQPGKFLGVSFEEAYSDADDSTGKTLRKRTGLAVISNATNPLHLLYFKRHLVPIAESFSLTHSSTPPGMYTIDFPHPSDVKKIDWAPGPNFTRPISLTASICLDFTAPSPFVDLDSKPALILAPARTWDPSIGYAMWKQAKQRAEEIGSMVLWCDGGEGGVSGIGGGGFSNVHQVGSGSWVKTIGIAYPFDTRRTPYAYFGDSTLLLYWILAFGGLAGGVDSTRFRRLKARNGRPIETSSPPNLLD